MRISLLLKILLPVFFLFFIMGCSSATKLKYLNEPYSTMEIKIPLTVSGIEFSDNRADTASRGLNIPKFSKKGQSDIVNQSLLQEHTRLINNEIGKYFEKTGKEVKAVVELIEGVKRFEAGSFSETEYVKVRLGLTLVDAEHTPYFLKSSGEAMYEIKSLDAKNEFIELLYQKALKAALHKCCEGIEGALKQVS